MGCCLRLDQVKETLGARLPACRTSDIHEVRQVTKILGQYLLSYLPFDGRGPPPEHNSKGLADAVEGVMSGITDPHLREACDATYRAVLFLTTRAEDAGATRTHSICVTLADLCSIYDEVEATIDRRNNPVTRAIEDLAAFASRYRFVGGKVIPR